MYPGSAGHTQFVSLSEKAKSLSSVSMPLNTDRVVCSLKMPFSDSIPCPIIVLVISDDVQGYPEAPKEIDGLPDVLVEDR